MLQRLRRARLWLRHEAGQTTAEYALVLLGAAGIATLLIAWARGGAIADLFDDVIKKIKP
jgi:Flp pilus assembly pilin Flp